MKFVPKELKKTADISRGNRSSRSFTKDIFSFVIVLAVIYITLGFVADLIALYIPDKYEEKAFSISRDHSTNPLKEIKRPQDILNKLLTNKNLRGLQYQLIIMDMEEPNAFALPGGTIGMTSALLKTVESEKGLAMVLAHEIGHHEGRHPLKRMGRAILYSLAYSLIFGNDDLSLAQTSLQIAESGYSRKQEKEADLFALNLVRKTFVDTTGVLEFFEKMYAEQKNEKTKWTAFLTSHPQTPDRIIYLKQAMKIKGSKAPK